MPKLMPIVLAIASIALSGCATPLQRNQVRVTFQSEPAGAIIYWAEKAYGIAPQTLTFTLSEADVQRGGVDDSNIRAVWPSGAEQRGIRLSMQVREGEFKFSRPPHAPGLDKDLAWSIQYKQASDQGMSGAEALLLLTNSALQGYNQGRQQSSPPPRPINCTSTTYRGTTQTTCK